MSILNSYFLSGLALILCAVLTSVFGFTTLMLTADITVGMIFVASVSSVFTTMYVSTHLQIEHMKELAKD